MPREVDDDGAETPAQRRAREKEEAKAEAAAEAKRKARENPPATPTSTSAAPPPAAASPYADEYFKQLAAGETMGNELFADGSLGRLADPNTAAVQELLARQKAALGGMDEATQNAARENALLQINDQANGQLGQISNVAAGRGLRGGVVRGAQAPVLGAAAGAYSGALRNLAGQVAQSQQDAATMYGTTLNNQGDIDRGVQNSNNAAADAEFQGRLTTPFDYANANTVYRSGDAADKLAKEAALLGASSAGKSSKSSKSAIGGNPGGVTYGIYAPPINNNTPNGMGSDPNVMYDREGRRVNASGELIDIFGNVINHQNAPGSSKSKPTPINQNKHVQ